MIITTLVQVFLVTQIFGFRNSDFDTPENKKLPLLFSSEDDGIVESDFENVVNQSLSFEMPSFHRRKRRFYNYESSSDVLSTSRGYGLLCQLCIMMDTQFITQYGSDDLELELNKMVNKISWIFRATDWNGDTIPDNLGFEVHQVRKNWKLVPNESLEEYGAPRDALELLRIFGRDASYAVDCCLAIGLTMKPFLDFRAAVSLITSRKVMGGICERRFADPAEKIASMNLVLITGAGPNEQNLDLEQLTMVLLHELGHSFGGRHDNSAEASEGTNSDEGMGRLITLRECSGYKPRLPINDTRLDSSPSRQMVDPPNGRFIMWSQSDTTKKALRPNNLLFSNCSKRSIAQVIQSGRTSCFVRDWTPFCGNGILEAGEDCDIGVESNSEEQKCCGSRQSLFPCKIPNTNESSDCSRFVRGVYKSDTTDMSSVSRARLSHQEANPDRYALLLLLAKIISEIILFPFLPLPTLRGI